LEQLLATRNLNELPRRSRPIFYAQAWLLVHLLYLGHLGSPDVPDYTESLQKLLAAVNDGQTPERAWLSAFAQTPEQFDAALREYFRAQELPSLRYSYEQ